MGVCASHHSTEKKTTRDSKKKSDVVARASASASARAWSESFRRPPWIMVMNISSGAIKEYRQPIRASFVLSENNPSSYLSNAESTCIGTCMPRVPDDEELLPGRIYFLVPLSHSHYPLSLSLLCDLAVKASSALNVPVLEYEHYPAHIVPIAIPIIKIRSKMKMLHLPLFSLAALTLFLISVHAGNPNPVPAPPPPPSAANEFLEAHNQARAAVGVEPLQWSEKLSKDTSLLVRYQRNNNGCQFANLTTSKYGGNQLWAGSAAVTPRMAVEEWVKEKDFYIHGNNSCVGKHECGVYTQVVWKKSMELGCSQATCVKEKASLTICFYDPPGNVIGESPY